MLYNAPTGSTDPNAPYVGKNVAAGIQGSRVPPGAAEFPQREIVNAIIAAGLTPTNADLTQLAQAIAKIAAQAGVSVAQASKSIFNVKSFQTNTRTSMSQQGANVLVTPWAGLNYTKQSSTSNVLIFGNFQNFTPGGSGATRVRFTLGSVIFDSGVSNGITQSASGAAASLAFGNSPVVRLQNVPAGVQAGSLSFFRTDTASWATVFNPNSGDIADYPATNTATLIFMEVEPS